MKVDDKTFDRVMDMTMLILCFLYLFLCGAHLLTPTEQVVTTVTGAFGLFIGYRWGSSKQSAKKDEVIANMSNQPTINSASDKTNITLKDN